MKDIKNILVGLDLSMLDQTILKCSALLKRYYPKMNISFTHIIPDTVLPEMDIPEIKAISRQQLEVIKEELKEEIESYFGEDENYNLSIKTGNPFLQIIDLAIHQNTDLLLMGKKHDLRGSGILPQELIRFSPTHLLFVPEKSHCEMSEIIVCNDFSEYSAMAMESALALARKDPEEITITSLHVSHTHDDEYATQEVIEKYNKFIERFDLENIHVNPKFLTTKNPNIAPVITRFVHQRKANMVITGSRGLSAHEGQILGSLTERLVRGSLRALLLVIKKPLTDPGLKDEMLRELYDLK